MLGCIYDIFIRVVNTLSVMSHIHSNTHRNTYIRGNTHIVTYRVKHTYTVTHTYSHTQ